MADAGNKIGQFNDEVERATTEVAQDVKDSVGQALEQGVQSVVGTQLNPQQVQQKQVEDQKNLTETRRKIRWYQDLAASQKRVREQEKQKKTQKQQLEEQEKQNKKMEEERKRKVIISPAKKRPMALGQQAPIEEIARTRQEIGKGHGVGG